MLTGEIKTDEWDELSKRLLFGVTKRSVGAIAGFIMEGRIQATYDYRWDKALNGGNSGIYGEIKEQLGLPAGTLTGSSRRAITSEADDTQARVYLHGTWPNDQVAPQEESFSTIPGTGEEFARILRARSAMKRAQKGEEEDEPKKFKSDARGAWLPEPIGFIPSEPFETKVYGGERGGAEIQWFYPFPEDEIIVGFGVEAFIDFLIEPSKKNAAVIFEGFNS